MKDESTDYHFNHPNVINTTEYTWKQITLGSWFYSRDKNGNQCQSLFEIRGRSRIFGANADSYEINTLVDL